MRKWHPLNTCWRHHLQTSQSYLQHLESREQSVLRQLLSGCVQSIFFFFHLFSLFTVQCLLLVKFVIHRTKVSRDPASSNTFLWYGSLEFDVQVIFDCRFLALMAVMGSLAGSILCFFKVKSHVSIWMEINLHLTKGNIFFCGLVRGTSSDKCKLINTETVPCQWAYLWTQILSPVARHDTWTWSRPPDNDNSKWSWRLRFKDILWNISVAESICWLCHGYYWPQLSMGKAGFILCGWIIQGVFPSSLAGTWYQPSCISSCGSCWYVACGTFLLHLLSYILKSHYFWKSLVNICIKQMIEAIKCKAQILAQSVCLQLCPS